MERQFATASCLSRGLSPCFLHHEHLHRFTTRHKLKAELVEHGLLYCLARSPVLCRPAKVDAKMLRQAGLVENRFPENAFQKAGKA